MNVGQALSYGRSSLAGASDTPARDAALLLTHVLGKPPEYAYLHPEDPVGDGEYRLYLSLIERRKSGEPAAYLTGIREFMGLPFKVDPRALIPRPETELVVETMIRILREEGDPPRDENSGLEELRSAERGKVRHVIADICCGSGAIGLSIAKLAPDVSVILTDVSREAVALARENADRLGIGDRVTFLVGDLVEPLLAKGMSRALDAVAANPPYIPSEEMGSLPPTVRDFEPHLALDGGRLGLEVISRLARETPQILKPGGYLVMEIGGGQGDACMEIFRATGGWHSVSVSNDYAGRQRVVVGRTRFAG